MWRAVAFWERVGHCVRGATFLPLPPHVLEAVQVAEQLGWTNVLLMNNCGREQRDIPSESMQYGVISTASLIIALSSPLI